MECDSKNTHYTDTERLLLAQLISEEHIIENKKTGASDLKYKAEAWERITTKYCSQDFPPRTSKQLKKCWDNMKQKKKKLNTSIKVQRLMTGGGVAPAIPVDPVMNLMDVATPNIDIEVPCPFDSTAQMEKEYHIKTNSNRQFIVYSGDETEEAILATIDMTNDSLEINSDKENSTSFISQRLMCNVNNIDISKTIKRKQAPASKVEKDFHNINDEKQLRLIKLRDAIAQQRELHAKKMEVADAEIKIALLKLLMIEENAKQQSDIPL